MVGCHYWHLQICPICGACFKDTISPDGKTVDDYILCEECITDSEVLTVIKSIECAYAANPPSFFHGLFLSTIRSRIARAMRNRMNNSVGESIQDEYRECFKKTKP